ncbi:MAG: DUF1801 domain-containing protein [Fimbriimonas sp.]
MAKLLPAVDQTTEVEAFMEKLDHPLKASIQAIRDCTKAVHPEITEQVKWNAPTFGYRGEYLFTFHLRSTTQVHIVFHNPLTPMVSSPLLEGTYADGRRMTYFKDARDFETQRGEFERVLRELLRAIDTA